MNRKLNILPILLLMLLIAGGTAFAVTGLKLAEAEETVQDQLYRENTVQKIYHPKVSETKRTITGAPLMLAQDRVDPVQEYPGAAEEGITVGELMRLMGILSIISAIIILLCIEFLFKHRIQQINYRVLLAADEVSCTSCHGPAHPVPAEREAVAAQYGNSHSSPAGSLATRIEPEDVKAIMEAINNEQN